MSSFNPYNGSDLSVGSTNAATRTAQAQRPSAYQQTSSASAASSASRSMPRDYFPPTASASAAPSSIDSAVSRYASYVAHDATEGSQVLTQKGYSAIVAGSDKIDLNCDFITYTSAKVKGLVCVKFVPNGGATKKDIDAIGNAKADLKASVEKAYVGSPPRDDVRSSVIGFSIKGELTTIDGATQYAPKKVGVLLKFHNMTERDAIMKRTGWDQQPSCAEKVYGTPHMLWTLPASSTENLKVNHKI